MKTLLKNLCQYPTVVFIGMLCLGFFCLAFSSVYQQVNFSQNLYFFTNLNLPSIFEAPWRFITPLFIHHDILHLATNLLCWFELARQVEKNHGAVVLLFFTLCIGMLSNTCEFIMVDNQFGGLSGVVFGLAGYIITLKTLLTFANTDTDTDTKNTKQSTVWYFPSIYILALAYILIADVMGMNKQNAIYAHISGFVCGTLLALVYYIFVVQKYKLHTKH